MPTLAIERLFKIAQVSKYFRCPRRTGSTVAKSLLHSKCMEEAKTKAQACKSPDSVSGLFQLRVLGFGLLQDDDIGVGVLPEGEEVFVGLEGTDAGGVSI